MSLGCRFDLFSYSIFIHLVFSASRSDLYRMLQTNDMQQFEAAVKVICVFCAPGAS
jgi:hypothetical protein